MPHHHIGAALFDLRGRPANPTPYCSDGPRVVEPISPDLLPRTSKLLGQEGGIVSDATYGAIGDAKIQHPQSLTSSVCAHRAMIVLRPGLKRGICQLRRRRFSPLADLYRTRRAQTSSALVYSA